MSDERVLTVDDLLAMNHAQRREVMMKARPFEPAALENSTYLGVDLSLPPIMNKILWKTFRKTFYRDPASGVLRGWNVRLQQTGWAGPGKPLLNGKGKPIWFGHYRVLPAAGLKFPGGWVGAHYLDYTVAGNPWYDVAGLGYCPLVAVNEGSSDLLLGWEIFKLGPVFVPLPDFWALKREGPLPAEEVAAVPCPQRAR